MRRIALVLALATSTATTASANPIEALRGAIVDGVGSHQVNWDGYYFGLHGATGTSDINFTSAMSDLAGAAGLGQRSASGSGFGGFVGYNAQWDQALLGVELNYTRGNFGGGDSIVGGGGSVTAASIDIKDMGTARLRAGWAAGQFMPYVFGGMSFGIADIARYVTVNGVFTDSIFQNRHSIYGYAAGAGLEMMLFGNVFLRGEFEYAKFAAPVDTSVTTARVGAGIKF